MTTKKKSSNTVKELVASARSLVLALIVVFAIRSVLAEPFRIPSGSMLPTLWIGDHLFVNKLAYGLNIPFSEWILGSPTYIVRWSEPARGDIIVFKYPEDESLFYIKRIIGLPGDKIELRNRVVYVNGKAAKQTPVSDEAREKAFASVQDRTVIDTAEREVFLEELPSERVGSDKETPPVTHAIFFKNYSSPLLKDFGPIRVPEENYFVMGDNRDESKDSRYWGFVPEKNLRGKASFVWFHMSLGLSEGQKFSFHPTRIGTSIK